MLLRKRNLTAVDHTPLNHSRTPSEKYRIAMRLRLPVMSLEWVQAAERLGYSQMLTLSSPELVRLW